MEGSGFRHIQAVSDTLPVRQYNQAKTGGIIWQYGIQERKASPDRGKCRSSGPIKWIDSRSGFLLNGLRTFFQLHPAFYRRFYQFTVIPFTPVSESGMSLKIVKSPQITPKVPSI